MKIPKKRGNFRPSRHKRRPSDPDLARQWLGEVADHLSNYPYAGPAFRFVASAIKRYLRGSKNLNTDRARALLYSKLGLVERPGRRETFTERTAKKAQGIMIELKQKNKKTPWHIIGDQLGIDKRSVKAMYQKRVKEKQLAELDRDMKQVLEEMKQQ